MKKKYESPMAEKYEFNYVENVVASGLIESETDNAGSGSVASGKNGKNNSGCFKGNSGLANGCQPQ